LLYFFFFLHSIREQSRMPKNLTENTFKVSNLLQQTAYYKCDTKCYSHPLYFIGKETNVQRVKITYSWIQIGILALLI
jgi:hypothetical protein